DAVKSQASATRHKEEKFAVRRLLLVLFAAATVGVAAADSGNLEGGVFIAHCAAALHFSSDPPPEGWCKHYLDHHAISDCKDQANRIDTERGVIWYVLCAWSEGKKWCGTEFGFGAYEPAIFAFIDWGPCFPDAGLELPGAMWPGPEEGTALTTTAGSNWSGNFLPVYYFAGYAYAEGIIPLSVDPNMGFGGTGNCERPPTISNAEGYGGMGLFTDGIYACPRGSRISPLTVDPKISPGTPAPEHREPSLFVRGSPGPTPGFRFAIEKRAWVTLKVYNPSGRLISTLEDGPLYSGTFLRTWHGFDQDGDAVPSGVYFGQLEVDGNQIDQRRITVVR
ncbi:MAG: hypothetical protein KAY24_18315, partial [Candidatus Eisenbacteria sp.]|nr:hypothetical protein [Candidatus Eisenbacteria bacterium]